MWGDGALPLRFIGKMLPHEKTKGKEEGKDENIGRNMTYFPNFGHFQNLEGGGATRRNLPLN